MPKWFRRKKKKNKEILKSHISAPILAESWTQSDFPPLAPQSPRSLPQQPDHFAGDSDGSQPGYSTIKDVLQGGIPKSESPQKKDRTPQRPAVPNPYHAKPAAAAATAEAEGSPQLKAASTSELPSVTSISFTDSDENFMLHTPPVVSKHQHQHQQPRSQQEVDQLYSKVQKKPKNHQLPPKSPRSSSVSADGHRKPIKQTKATVVKSVAQSSGRRAKVTGHHQSARRAFENEEQFEEEQDEEMFSDYSEESISISLDEEEEEQELMEATPRPSNYPSHRPPNPGSSRRPTNRRIPASTEIPYIHPEAITPATIAPAAVIPPSMPAPSPYPNMSDSNHVYLFSRREQDGNLHYYTATPVNSQPSSPVPPTSSPLPTATNPGPVGVSAMTSTPIAATAGQYPMPTADYQSLTMSPQQQQQQQQVQVPFGWPNPSLSAPNLAYSSTAHPHPYPHPHPHQHVQAPLQNHPPSSVHSAAVRGGYSLSTAPLLVPPRVGTAQQTQQQHLEALPVTPPGGALHSGRKRTLSGVPPEKMPGTGTSSTTHVSSEVVSKLLAQKDMQSRKEMESIREESAKLRGENEALRELYQSLRDDLVSKEVKKLSFSAVKDEDEVDGECSPSPKSMPLLKTYEKRLEEKDKAVKKLEGEVRMLREKVVRLEEDRHELLMKEEVREKTQKEEWQGLVNQSKSLLEENTGLLRQQELQKQEMLDMRNRHELKVSQMSNEVERLKADREALNGDLAALRENHVRLQKEFEAILKRTSKHITVEEHRLALDEFHDLLEDFVDKTEENSKSQETHLKVVQKERKAAVSQLEAAKAIILQLEGQCTALQKERRRAQERIAKLQFELEVTKDKEVEAHSQLNKTIIQVERALAERDTFAEIARAQQKARDHLNSQKTRNEETVSSLEMKLLNQKLEASDNLEKASLMLSEREKQYRMQRRHYDEELRHLRALLQRKQREVDTLSKSKRRVESQLQESYRSNVSRNKRSYK